MNLILLNPRYENTRKSCICKWSEIDLIRLNSFIFKRELKAAPNERKAPVMDARYFVRCKSSRSLVHNKLFGFIG